MRIAGLALFFITAIGLVILAAVLWEAGEIVEACWLLLLSIVPIRFLWTMAKKYLGSQ